MAELVCINRGKVGELEFITETPPEFGPKTIVAEPAAVAIKHKVGPPDLSRVKLSQPKISPDVVMFPALNCPLEHIAPSTAKVHANDDWLTAN